MEESVHPDYDMSDSSGVCYYSFIISIRKLTVEQEQIGSPHEKESVSHKGVVDKTGKDYATRKQKTEGQKSDKVIGSKVRKARSVKKKEKDIFTMFGNNTRWSIRQMAKKQNTANFISSIYFFFSAQVEG